MSNHACGEKNPPNRPILYCTGGARQHIVPTRGSDTLSGAIKVKKDGIAETQFASAMCPSTRVQPVVCERPRQEAICVEHDRQRGATTTTRPLGMDDAIAADTESHFLALVG